MMSTRILNESQLNITSALSHSLRISRAEERTVCSRHSWSVMKYTADVEMLGWCQGRMTHRWQDSAKSDFPFPYFESKYTWSQPQPPYVG